MVRPALLIGFSIGALCVPALVSARQSQAAADSETESVVVRMVIGTDGVPFNPVVIKGLTPEKDQSSLAAIRQWRFRPGMKNGKPVPVVATIAINFGPRDSTTPQIRQGVSFSGPISIAEQERALLEWYICRAQAGDTDSQVEAAVRLSPKRAPDADLVRACAWAIIAERNGSKEASKLRAKLAKRMAADQIDEAHRMAGDWRPGTPLAPR